MEKIGILDPNGINNNPLTNEPYSDKYRELAKFWSNFPAYQNPQEIIDTISKNQVILVISGTGSGKTVLVPKYLLHVFNYDKKIAITLPKQIIAKSSAEFAADTLDVQLGKDVGYKYKGSDKKAYSKDAKLLYCTDGTIVAMLLNQPDLKDFDGVIVDEAHERKVQIDFLLYLLRNTVKLRPEFKLIIMSATVNQEIFQSYFEQDGISFTTINIGAKTNYPIKSIFLDKEITVDQFADTGYQVLKKIIDEDKITPKNKDEYHDILFFVTSSNEAKDLCEKVTKDNLDGFCIEVFSGMKSDNEKLAKDKDLYKQQTTKNRKIVIATNVAESSLTIDGIKFVIDAGFEIFGYYDPIKHAKVLTKQLITQAQAKQRMGRTGRTGPGICYHLYTKDQFENKMKKFPEPTIRTSNIYGECLRLLVLPNIQTVPKLLDVLTQFIEPPREEYIKLAISLLKDLELIKDMEITELGKIVGQMQTQPIESLALLLGKKYNCSKEISAIFAMTDAIKENINELFILPPTIFGADATEESKRRMRSLMNKFKDSQAKLAHKYGDHLSLLKIFTKYRELRSSDGENSRQKISEFCYKYFIKSTSLDKAYTYYKKIKDSVRQVNNIPLEPNPEILNKDLEYRILHCLNYGFRFNIAKLNQDNESYRTPYINHVKLNPNNFIQFKHKKPENKLFYQAVTVGSAKTELNITSLTI